jgi:hypothetical protein
MESETKYWLITYKQPHSRDGGWYEENAVSNIHPVDWLISREKNSPTVVTFAIEISAADAERYRNR